MEQPSARLQAIHNVSSCRRQVARTSVPEAGAYQLSMSSGCSCQRHITPRAVCRHPCGTCEVCRCRTSQSRRRRLRVCTLQLHAPNPRKERGGTLGRTLHIVEEHPPRACYRETTCRRRVGRTLFVLVVVWDTRLACELAPVRWWSAMKLRCGSRVCSEPLTRLKPASHRFCW